MPPCSMACCPEREGEEGEGETAFKDQRAVAAGKNLNLVQLAYNFYRILHNLCPNPNNMCLYSWEQL